jgi:hypothetical protein
MSALTTGAFGRIEARDRNLLIACGVLVTLLIVALALFSPSRQEDENPTPLSYSTGKHGAKAAFELLGKAGYNVERQNAPLSEIIDRIDEHTTLVIAEPYMLDVVESRATMKQALDQGARILVTGPSGAMLVPGNGLDYRDQKLQRDCEAEANGFGEIANSGKVQMPVPVPWVRNQPLQSVEYTCDGQAAVVRYASGKGEVIWWANSFPLEYVGIQREDNLALFLNSIGPVSNHVVWDESLHGEPRSLWSYSNGTPIHFVWGQLAMVAFLLLFSYSRRRGPLRPDPIVSRATPVEFIHSLGSLYQKAGATRVAVAIAYQRFRHKLEKQFDVSQSLTAEDPALLEVLTSRFAVRAAGIQKDLLACENAASVEDLTARQALTLVQTLYDDEALITAKPVTK